MKGWKFGMILVEVCEETGEEICELVELYTLDDENNYGMWCHARLMSPDELELAHADVQRDGINRWFYENGTFTHEVDEEMREPKWDWKPKQIMATS
tara:strand:- start:137 stop:427 length:291 start_codon:yes stop_codon:yes gene_type:complete